MLLVGRDDLSSTGSSITEHANRSSNYGPLPKTDPPGDPQISISEIYRYLQVRSTEIYRKDPRRSTGSTDTYVGDQLMYINMEGSLECWRNKSSSLDISIVILYLNLLLNLSFLLTLDH